MNTNGNDSSRKMLKVIREFQSHETQESANTGNIAIKRNDQRFGELRRNQESQIIKTIDANVVFGENALVFTPGDNDNNLSLNGSIPSLNMKFQFQLNAPSGEGCYIWANGLQLTESNTKAIGKLHNAFENWKHQLIEDSEIISRMQQELTGQNA